ncbi:hypothetical protein [Mesorhizobium sp. SP-1A]|uniref:hypothetical protein n=1 Tax=Mesorhizobium sp. SP-1A TaxID=3077840 RepID=UPI0028F738C0|nr:hypothetical protein [Mesorhizobium sp. SP-1A]
MPSPIVPHTSKTDMVARLLAGFASYLLLVGQIGGEEIAAAAATAFLLGVFSPALAPNPPPDARRLLSKWSWSLAHLPQRTAAAATILLRVALRGGSPGESCKLPFQVDAGRWNAATAILTASLAPDSFVVRTIACEGRALVHTILHSPLLEKEWRP